MELTETSMKDRVYMEDVARACGVNKTTVCKALRDAYDVSEGRKKQILDKCEEMGFQKPKVRKSTRA